MDEIKNLEKYYKEWVPTISEDFEFVGIKEIRKSVGSNVIYIKHLKCGRIIDIISNNYKYRKNCRFCDKHRYDKEAFIDLFNSVRDDSSEYEILTFNGVTAKLSIKHNVCGKTFDIRADSLIQYKSKCPCIYGKHYFRHDFNLLNERIKEADSEYELYSVKDEPIRVLKDRVKIIHKTCGTVFDCIPHNFLSYNKKRCPNCRIYPKNLIGFKDSKGVQIIESWIKSKGLYYEKEKTFKNLVSPSTGRKLRYDFYIPDLNLIIEFDGKQHFDTRESSLFTKEKYDKIRLHDKIKDKYCERYKINLIRIKYTDSTEKYIYKVLNKFYNKEVRIYCIAEYDE